MGSFSSIRAPFGGSLLRYRNQTELFDCPPCTKVFRKMYATLIIARLTALVLPSTSSCRGT